MNNSNSSQSTNITLIGIGGTGGHIVGAIAEQGMKNVDYLIINYNEQPLKQFSSLPTLLIGQKTLPRPFCRVTPSWSTQAVIDDSNLILEPLTEVDTTIIIAGIAGDFAAGATPAISRICKNASIYTNVIISRPLPFEGKQRNKLALNAIHKIYNESDCLLQYPNDSFYTSLDGTTTVRECYAQIDEMLYSNIKGLINLLGKKS